MNMTDSDRAIEQAFVHTHNSTKPYKGPLPSRYPGNKKFHQTEHLPEPDAQTWHDTYAKRGLARSASILSFAKANQMLGRCRDLFLGLHLLFSSIIQSPRDKLTSSTTVRAVGGTSTTRVVAVRRHGILPVARQLGQRKRDRYLRKGKRLDAPMPNLCSSRVAWASSSSFRTISSDGYKKSRAQDVRKGFVATFRILHNRHWLQGIMTPIPSV